MLAKVVVAVRAHASALGYLVDECQEYIDIFRTVRLVNGDTFFGVVSVDVTGWLVHPGDDSFFAFREVNQAGVLGVETLVVNLFPAVALKVG